MKDTNNTKQAKSGNNQPTNQQVLYIGLDENVTDVRQRLNQADVQYITLVVPSQTQLRGQVTWKLLAARAQELGQVVSVVSNDPYIRAMAQSVHFSVTSSTPRSKVS
jgi:hypothetical protein